MFAQLKGPNKEPYRLRGYCYTKMEDLESALADFQKVVEKDGSIPKNVKAGYNRALLGLALLEYGKVDEAGRGKIISPPLICTRII